LRGDEGNNVDEIGQHALVTLRASYAPTERLELFVTIDNLLDREYETFGLFGEPDDVLGGEFEDPRFVSPGAPRAAWLGVRVSL
jgi:outer membrane receptor protein involved in Fe transport